MLHAYLIWPEPEIPMRLRPHSEAIVARLAPLHQLPRGGVTGAQDHDSTPPPANISNAPLERRMDGKVSDLKGKPTASARPPIRPHAASAKAENQAVPSRLDDLPQTVEAILSGEELTRLRLRLAWLVGQDEKMARELAGWPRLVVEFGVTFLHGRVVAVELLSGGGDSIDAHNLGESLTRLVRGVEFEGIARDAPFRLSLVIFLAPGDAPNRAAAGHPQ